jgi:hypothetical protein
LLVISVRFASVTISRVDTDDGTPTLKNEVFLAITVAAEGPRAI